MTAPSPAGEPVGVDLIEEVVEEVRPPLRLVVGRSGGFDQLECGHEVRSQAPQRRTSIYRPEPKRRHCWPCGYRGEDAKYVKARSEWLSRQHGPDAEYRLR